MTMREEEGIEHDEDRLDPAPTDVRWNVVIPASMALLFALGAVLLAGRALVWLGAGPTWATHLAGAALVVAGVSSVASIVAIVAATMGAPPGV
ncbi:MAG: hypothetical protein QOJ69_2112 [Actinomycetota bacterium]|jgi:hypothetical protein|nr:hypothetical protein [Actinomycetota bacterium]